MCPLLPLTAYRDSDQFPAVVTNAGICREVLRCVAHSTSHTCWMVMPGRHIVTPVLQCLNDWLCQRPACRLHCIQSSFKTCSLGVPVYDKIYCVNISIDLHVVMAFSEDTAGTGNKHSFTAVSHKAMMILSPRSRSFLSSSYSGLHGTVAQS